MDCEILRLHCVSLRMTRMWEFENNSSVNCVDTFPSKGRQELATSGRPYDGGCAVFLRARVSLQREGQPLPYDWLHGLSGIVVGIARFFATL